MIKFIKQLNNNPVFIKEMMAHERVNSRKKFRLPSWVGYFAILLLPLVFTSLMFIGRSRLSINDMKSTFMVVIVLQTLYFTYRGASHAWSLIAKERELKTLGNLLSTALSPKEIVLGKFWAAFYPLAKELTLLLPVFVGMGILLGVGIFPLLLVYIINLIYIAFFGMVGLYFSGRSKTVIQARNNSIRVIAGLIVGTFLLATLITVVVFSIFGGFRSSQQLFGMILFIPSMILYALNPISSVWALIVMISASGSRYSGMPSFFVTGYVAFNMVLYMVISYVLYKKTVKRIGDVPG